MATTPAIQSLLIDHREPHWMHALRPDGATVAVTQLSCGDVWLAASDGALLIVERKTAADLLASIADGRLFDQAAAMVALSPWSYVVVQGTLTPHNGFAVVGGEITRWQWASVQGALQTIQEMGVAVIYLSGDDTEREFARFLERLAGRDRGPVRAGAPRKVELLAPGLSLLMALPGIGGDRAKTLLDQAGTAAFALSVVTDDALNAVGIGPGTRAKVREALGLKEGEYIEIATV